MKNSVTVVAPATSANLGPGFDVAGMAVSVFCKVSFSITGKTLEISGCPREYANKANLSYVSFVKTLQMSDKPIPEGLLINIDSDIPVSRGMGSSSALIVAGIKAADYLYELDLDDKKILSIATEIEGHPDNVAPCILGGFVSSYVNDGECYEVCNRISENLRFAMVIPSYQVSTEKARGILPDSYSREDVVFSVAHYALLVEGFSSGNEKILKEALKDRIHQPYRKTLIPQYDTVHQLAMNNGAVGSVISGSGSTMLIVGNTGTDFDVIKAELLSVFPDCEFRIVEPCTEGAVCLENI